MTDLIIMALQMLFSLFLSFMPDMSAVGDVISNADSAVGTVFDFIAQVNFIVPLPTLSAIFAIEVSIHIIAFTGWIGHKVVSTLGNIIF